MHFNYGANRVVNYTKPNSYSRVQTKQVYLLNRSEAFADYQIISLILRYIDRVLSPCSLPTNLLTNPKRKPIALDNGASVTVSKHRDNNTENMEIPENKQNKFTFRSVNYDNR